MQDVKNMTRGIIFSLIFIVTTIIIPYLTFSWVKDFQIEGLEITMEQTQYENIIFWVTAFGLLISGFAFVSYSSPSQSIRRAVFSLIQIILNCFYIWSYKFSGALEIEFKIETLGNASVNLEQLILIYLGVYFLTILLRVFDLIDFTWNRFKIREEREAKQLAKEVK